MAALISGRQFWLWRAVDDEGEILDLLVQRRRDAKAYLWATAGELAAGMERQSFDAIPDLRLVKVDWLT